MEQIDLRRRVKATEDNLQGWLEADPSGRNLVHGSLALVAGLEAPRLSLALCLGHPRLALWPTLRPSSALGCLKRPRLSTEVELRDWPRAAKTELSLALALSLLRPRPSSMLGLGQLRPN